MMPPNTPRTSGIYVIYSSVNGRSYIGSAVNFSKRWGTHLACLRKGTHDNPHLQRAWNKYGEDAFEFEILEECATDALHEREQYYFDLFPDKYNCAPVAGTQLGFKHSPEAKAKMSASRTGQVIPPETRAKISAALAGRKKSPESIEKRTLSRKGFTQSPEAREKIRQANLGKKQSLETIAKRVATIKANSELRRVEEAVNDE